MPKIYSRIYFQHLMVDRITFLLKTFTHCNRTYPKFQHFVALSYQLDNSTIGQWSEQLGEKLHTQFLAKNAYLIGVFLRVFFSLDVVCAYVFVCVIVCTFLVRSAFMYFNLFENVCTRFLEEFVICFIRKPIMQFKPGQKHWSSKLFSLDPYPHPSTSLNAIYCSIRC